MFRDNVTAVSSRMAEIFHVRGIWVIHGGNTCCSRSAHGEGWMIGPDSQTTARDHPMGNKGLRGISCDRLELGIIHSLVSRGQAVTFILTPHPTPPTTAPTTSVILKSIGSADHSQG